PWSATPWAKTSPGSSGRMSVRGEPLTFWISSTRRTASPTRWYFRGAIRRTRTPSTGLLHGCGSGCRFSRGSGAGAAQASAGSKSSGGTVRSSDVIRPSWPAERRSWLHFDPDRRALHQLPIPRPLLRRVLRVAREERPQLVGRRRFRVGEVEMLPPAALL